MKREQILQNAEKILNGKRAKEYGDAYENHERIAKLWSVILSKDVTVAQVYQCMIAVKLARLNVTPDHADSWLDICGYAALGGEGNGKTTNEHVRPKK
tara:strand:- start:76 stop:369 length:294 start_codon:yes stop_codon:yes gene_type:complete